jgi:hypothetical protein
MRRPKPSVLFFPESIAPPLALQPNDAQELAQAHGIDAAPPNPPPTLTLSLSRYPYPYPYP